MIFTQFSSNTPFTRSLNGYFILPMHPATAYWLGAMQAGMAMQYQLINALSLGLLDDIAAEVEHALVEGRDLGQTLVDQIQALQGSSLDAEQKQFLARNHLSQAEDNFQQLLRQLITNLVQLPFTRLNGQPPRKRFAVTLEGELLDKHTG